MYKRAPENAFMHQKYSFMHISYAFFTFGEKTFLYSDFDLYSIDIAFCREVV